MAFDLALAAGLFALARRWRRWLGRGLAVAVTVDAVATWGETFAWNVPRATRGIDWLVVVVACGVPTVAAVILWGALGHRESIRGPAGKVSSSVASRPST